MDHTCKQDEIVAHLGNESLQCTLVQKLYSQCWVNDEVVNFIIQMLEIQQVIKDNNVLIMQSFFMSEALIGAKGSLGRATTWVRKQIRKDGNIYTYSKIVVPINIKRTPWACAVVVVISREIMYYDSMLCLVNGQPYLTALVSFMDYM